MHGIVGIGNVQKFNEAISIVRSRQFILGHVARRHPPDLGEQLDQQILIHLRVEISDVARRLLIAVFDRREGGHASCLLQLASYVVVRVRR